MPTRKKYNDTTLQSFFDLQICTQNKKRKHIDQLYCLMVQIRHLESLCLEISSFYEQLGWQEEQVPQDQMSLLNRASPKPTCSPQHGAPVTAAWAAHRAGKQRAWGSCGACSLQAQRLSPVSLRESNKESGEKCRSLKLSQNLPSDGLSSRKITMVLGNTEYPR